MERFQICVGGTMIGIGAWGPGDIDHGKNWSLAKLQTQEDVRSNVALCRHIRKAVHTMGVHTCLAPNVVAFSGLVTEGKALVNALGIGGKITIYRNKLVSADGVPVPKGHALIMSGAGSPAIIAAGRGMVIIGQAGLRSLVDMGAVVGNPTREHMGILYSIVSEFNKNGVPAKELSIHMVGAIAPHDYEHDTASNKNLLEFISERWPNGVWKRKYISLEGILLGQAKECGISRAQTSHPLDELLSLTHTRKDPTARNLFVIANRGKVGAN